MRNRLRRMASGAVRFERNMEDGCEEGSQYEEEERWTNQNLEKPIRTATLVPEGDCGKDQEPGTIYVRPSSDALNYYLFDFELCRQIFVRFSCDVSRIASIGLNDPQKTERPPATGKAEHLIFKY